MLSQNERHLKAVEQKMNDLADEAKAIIAKATEDGRERTEEENAEVTERHAAIENLKGDAGKLKEQIKIDEDILSTAQGIEVVKSSDVQVVDDRPVFKSAGEQFVESKAYQSLIEQGLGQQWKMDQVELHTKATLLTTPGTALAAPSYQAGIVEDLFEAPTISDLMPQAQAQSSVIRYVEETTATNNAATVAEGAAKPESVLAFGEVSEDVRKIATVLPVSDEMLEDAAQIQSYINQRLSLFVRIEEEEQLISGNGTAPNISGFLDRAINTYAAGTVDDNAVAIFKAANGTRGSSFLSPDAVVMNPANWQATRLLSDDNGQFYGGGPFYGPYGGPQGPASANRFSADNIWGLRVIVTSAITANTALLGSFRQAAQVFRKGGLTVDATNSHSDFFYKNLTAIRAEERLALAVYRPNAFTQITGLD